jgi:NRPS condensation-like uncharacterized protein
MPPLLSTPLWIRARDFDLDYHLRRVRAPGDASLRTVLELAAILVRQAFDPQRPPWECTLLESVEKGRAALILKLHHSITDGVGGVKLAARIARMGVTYLEVQGRAVESLPAREYTDYAWCFKALPACESGGDLTPENSSV